MKVIVAALLGCFLWGTSLRAQFDVGVVLPFANHTRDPKLDWISEGFVEVLSSNLASPRFILLDRRERAAAFDSLGIPNTSFLSDATIYKVAQALDANYLILGGYSYNDGVFKAAAQVLEMEGPTFSREFVEAGPLGNLLELQTGLAWQIQQFLRPSFSTSKSDYLQERKGPRLDAFENYLRGMISKDRGQQIRYYREAMRLDPRFTTPAFELGMIYFHNRDYPTSIPWLAKLRRGDPDYLEANYFLGLAYLYLEQYERSAAAFRVVAQQLPLNEVYNNLGIALMRQDRPGALQYFEKAIQGDPAEPDFQFNLGYGYWKRESYSEAIPHLRKALLGTNHPAWRVIYIQCLDKTGQTEESARQRRLLQQQAPDWKPEMDPRQLQKLERPKNNYDGASFRQLKTLLLIQAELKHAKLSLPDHVAAHFGRAEQFQQEGLEREAIEELQHVIDYYPEHAQAHQQLAELYLKAGRFPEALKAANQYLRLNKTASGHLLLARVYLGQGKIEEAQAQLDVALRLEPANETAEILREELQSKAVSRP